MAKVSVIIPVFNGEAYLRQCLDSVCAQTLEEIEIICVDDGSTDGSWKILEEYRERDPRFRLIRQQNLHVSAARNNGLARAQGKYVIFWDCDDFFEPKALELLYRRAEETEAEICVCGSDLYNQEDGRRYPDGVSLNSKRVPEGDTFDRFHNPEYILNFTNAAVWNKLFLHSFLKTNALTFPDFPCGEDRALLFSALCLALRIATVSEVLIHYRWNNPQSLVGRISQNPSDELRSLEFAVDQLIQRDIVPAECLGRAMLQQVIIVLHYTQTEQDFLHILRHLRGEDGGESLLERFGVVEREPGYYYSAIDDEIVKHILHDKPGDLLAFFMNDGWKKRRVLSADLRKLRAELKTTQAKLKTAQKKLNDLKNSRSYRLGRALLFIPRKIRDFFRRAA